MQSVAPVIYQCPNEPYPISQAVHLGRLASFYPLCRQCAHCHDTGTLSGGIVSMLNQTWQRPVATSLFHAEGVAGVHLNELSPALVRQVAAAFGIHIKRQTSGGQMDVVIAGDGRALAPEAVAAASDGLRWAGLGVLDLGSASAASLVCAVRHSGAAGGLLVGNAGGEPNTIGLKFWGQHARPFSAQGSLAEVQKLYEQGVDRPARIYGPLSRVQGDGGYLATLEGYFHALRPLRIVLDTACRPLVACLQRLSSKVACELILLREPAKSHAFGGLGLADRVRGERAHLGVWIDGDGEAFRAVDERGLPIGAGQLLILLARYLLKVQPAGTIVLEEEALASTAEQLAASGAHVVRGPSSRETMDEQMRRHQGLFGGGPSGRYWFRSQPGAADGLETLALLLTVLSQSDKNLSELVRGIA